MTAPDAAAEYDYLEPGLLDELEKETAENHAQSVLAIIGGPRAAAAVVEDWDGRLLADPVTAPLFEELLRSDRVSAFKRHQVLMLVMSLGGPNRYSGRSLQEAHKDVETSDGTPITETAYRVTYLHLNDVLHEREVAMKHRLTVHELLLSVEHWIVGGGQPAEAYS